MKRYKVAFICVHNSCRSQIAEALGKRMAYDTFDCYSAGTETKPQINQDAVRLMKNIYDIDMEKKQYSKLLADIPQVDIVITMGCNIECPYLPCEYREDWGLDDPTGKSDEEFIKVIKEIESKISSLKNKCNYKRLQENIIDVIKEEQIKLGYRKETIRLYYPIRSINNLLKSDLSAQEVQKELSDYFESANNELGRVQISHQQDRFCFLIPEDGVEYVHEHTKESEFIKDFIMTIGKHGCTIEDLLVVFRRYSNEVHYEKITNGEFDYLIYFVDGYPDEYRYCITDEGGHLIYHRFTQDDYSNL